MSIADLPAAVAALPAAGRQRFQRLFELTVAHGGLVPPPAMVPWIERQFGSVQAVERQTIVRLTNRWTLEGALFNPLRALRPVQAEAGALEQRIEASRGDAFCAPDSGTPADVFGRVRGPGAVTAANVAKYEAWCAVVIFDEHHPLRITEAGVASAIDTAWRWGQQAHAADPRARFWFFMWNCLQRAGSSVVHGHAQTALTRGSHFPQVQRWRAAARRYGPGYFEDLVTAHADVGLAFHTGEVAVLAHLTPIKERETVLIAPNLGPELSRALYRVLACFTQDLGVTAFNVGLYHRPLGRRAWPTFPVVVRIVDRGPAGTLTSDIGAMELFAASVVASDPFDTIAALRRRFQPARRAKGEA
jgi:hypothetical protein